MRSYLTFDKKYNKGQLLTQNIKGLKISMLNYSAQPQANFIQSNYSNYQQQGNYRQTSANVRMQYNENGKYIDKNPKRYLTERIQNKSRFIGSRALIPVGNYALEYNEEGKKQIYNSSNNNNQCSCNIKILIIIIVLILIGGIVILVIRQTSPSKSVLNLNQQSISPIIPSFAQTNGIITETKLQPLIAVRPQLSTFNAMHHHLTYT